MVCPIPVYLQAHLWQSIIPVASSSLRSGVVLLPISSTPLQSRLQLVWEERRTLCGQYVQGAHGRMHARDACAFNAKFGVSVWGSSLIPGSSIATKCVAR